MQNRRNSTASPFNSAASLSDGQLNPANSDAEYLATGILWPYSPLLSSTYFAGQAPLPTAVPTAAAYSIPIYCPSVKPHVLDANRHFHSHPSTLRSSAVQATENDSSNNNNCNNNNMTIQIGVQCVNEGSGETGKKASSCSVNREEVPPSREIQGDMNDKLYEFTKLAIHGCDLAERVTKNHKYRPCFKKIDSLCARLKQDISRPDGVLNNLNSQGMAWAVKDFIFVFTRIINAWLILKGYVYNQSEGMRKVQASFSGDFQASFHQWQAVTQQLIESIIESFENLDEAVHKSRTNGCNTPTATSGTAQGLMSCGGGKAHGQSTRMAPIDLSNFLWDNKEVTMRSSSGKSQGVAGVGSSCGEETRERERERSSSSGGGHLATPVYNEAERDSFETYYKTGLYQSMKRKGESGNGQQQEQVRSVADKENMPGQMNVVAAAPVMVVPVELDLIDKLNLESNIKRHEHETAGNIQYLLCRVRDIKESSYFFNVHFLKNYFPDFEKVITDMKDIRTIMVEAEQGKYKYVFALVADLRLIIQSCKLYLSLNPNAHLNEVVSSFENELELILSEKCFVGK